MAAFRFSRSAESDLLGIGEYTLHAWGEAQAVRYLRELEACCQTTGRQFVAGSTL
jgi:plasmid stabilization system protein ParE